MTFRERLADWISGGALTFHKNGWARSSALYSEAMADVRGYKEISADMVNALHRIAAEEKPTSNATVRRMARIAREALE